MAHVEAAKIVDAMHWRYATKAFDRTKSLTEYERQALLTTLRLSPSSYGLQPWKFIVVDDPSTRSALGAFVPPNKSKIEDCSLFVVLARRKMTTADDVSGHVEMLQRERELSEEALQPFRNMVTDSITSKSASASDSWNARQVYVALGCAVASAAMLGVDACPMEGVNAEGYDETLGLTGSEFTTTVAIAFGHRAEDDPFASFPRTRRPVADVIQVV